MSPLGIAPTGGSSLSSLGGKLIIDAQASISAPSIEKYWSENSRRTRTRIKTTAWNCLTSGDHSISGSLFHADQQVDRMPSSFAVRIPATIPARIDRVEKSPTTATQAMPANGPSASRAAFGES